SQEIASTHSLRVGIRIWWIAIIYPAFSSGLETEYRPVRRLRNVLDDAPASGLLPVYLRGPHVALDRSDCDPCRSGNRCASACSAGYGSHTCRPDRWERR